MPYEEIIMRKLLCLKLIYIIAIFFFIITLVLAQSELKMEDPLYQQGKILGKNFKVIYQYFSEEEKGIMVFNRGYLYEKVYSDKNKYISEYELLKEGLVKEYGKPILDQQIWKNDGYKGMKVLWGHAVSKGKLTFLSTWKTENIDIELSLYGKDYHIYLEIHTKTKE
jgi:hypothetical protein